MKIHGHRWPKGRGQALGPPVAMYFHKKQLIFSKYRSLYSQCVFFGPNKTPLDGQGWLWDGRVADGAAGGAGGELGGGADSQVCRLFSYRSERNHSFRSAS